MMCRRSESLLCPAGLFFFSSRRRHTRLQGDWSSDVCSSDLADPAGPFGNRAARVRAADARSAGLEAPPGSSGEAGSSVAPGHAVSGAPPGRGDTRKGKGRGISDGEAEGEGEGEAEGKAASEGGEARAPAHHPIEPPQATRVEIGRAHV